MFGRVRSRLRSIAARRLRLPEIPVALDSLRRQGVHPRHVFDVGAYQGDFARSCLERWPDTRVTCFEPLPHMRERLREVERNPRVTVYPCLLGSTVDPSVALHARETASSVLAEHHEAIPTIRCEQTTVDSIVEQDFARDPPDMLKLDVQGYELEVLKGSEGALGGIRVILAEVGLLDIHKGAPLLSEVVGWLAARGFVAFDVAGLTRRPLDGALWTVDLVFVRLDDPVRSDKRWASPA